MTNITEVELTHVPGQIERWLRFGNPMRDRIVDRRRRVLEFAPQQIFAFVRWAANDHGTVLSRIDIVRTIEVGEPSTTIPFIRPGGEILLRLSGWPKVQTVLAAIDAAEQIATATDVCPDHWRHVHQRLTVGEPYRAYWPSHHRAWVLRRRVGP